MEAFDPIANLEKAENLFKNQQWSSALDMYGDTLVRVPLCAEIFGNQAICAIHLGNIEFAEYLLKLASCRDVNRMAFYGIAAETYIQQEKFQEAKEECIKGLGRAKSFMKEDPETKALEMLKEWCEDNINITINDNKENFSSNCKSSVVKTIEKGSYQSPFKKFYEIGFISAETWKEIKEYLEENPYTFVPPVIPECPAAMEAFDPIANLEKAENLFKNQQWSSALDMYGDTLVRVPLCAEIFGNQAICAIHLGDIEFAEYLLKLASCRDVNRMAFYGIAAETYIQQEKFQEAKEECTKGLGRAKSFMKEEDPETKALKMLKEWCEDNINKPINDNKENFSSNCKSSVVKIIEKESYQSPFKKFYEIGFFSAETWKVIKEFLEEEENCA